MKRILAGRVGWAKVNSRQGRGSLVFKRQKWLVCGEGGAGRSREGNGRSFILEAWCLVGSQEVCGSGEPPIILE